MTFEGETLLQIKKWWDSIRSTLWQYLSTKNICPEYKYLKSDHQELSSFLFPPDTHPKIYKKKTNYQGFSREIRVNLAKYDTIPSSKSQKSHARLITFMNIDNGFELLFTVVFPWVLNLEELEPNIKTL